MKWDYVIVLLNEKLNKFERQTEINRIIGSRYNKEVYALIKEWCNFLFDKTDKIIKFQAQSYQIIFKGLPFSCGGATYRETHWDELDSFRFEEPKLCFSEESHSPGYVNQLKGLIANKPLSDSYSSITQPDIQLAILSPRDYEIKILDHLSKLNTYFESKTDKGFLPPYSGFEKVYKRKLNIPNMGDPLFYSYEFTPEADNYNSFYEDGII